MNAVEIADAVADLAAHPFEAAEFPFQFLAAFDKKETQLKRLRKGDTNRSDVPGGVLLQSNIHLAVCPAGEAHSTLERLKASPQTAKAKARFILATDGQTLEAEELSTGEAIASEFPKLAEHIGFFLPLAGISTVREIKDNPIDVRATGRLNKLYVELLRQNPEWGTEARRHDMNHFMARLIFCFFAEDTNIFPGGRGLFTSTVEQFTESDGSNTHQVLETLFRVMDIHPDKRDYERLPGWAVRFPYVNGGLFCDSAETPHFTRIARSYLLQAGSLDWQHINPDIFGSMIQAVADEGERGALGMHYTSVPNILKVLNPLFLDDLRAQLVAAGTNPRALRKLKERLRRIRVFDPACGSGNFLVIAYKQMREIEAGIDHELGDIPKSSVIPLSNFRGIEIRDFAVEIARLALVIAEYQSNVLYLGQEQANIVFLPLAQKNWIACGNALRLDWLRVCPPEGAGAILVEDDLFQTPLDQAAMDFENEGGETYICGNPPYLGKGKKKEEQLEDMNRLFSVRTNKFGYIDFVGCWLILCSEYCSQTGAAAALVATNSISQGRQLPQLWPLVVRGGIEIIFARRSFKWHNNAAKNAGVTCVIVGIAGQRTRVPKQIFTEDLTKEANHINPYLLDGDDLIVESRPAPLTPDLPKMLTGSVPNDDGNLILNVQESDKLRLEDAEASQLIRPFFGSHDFLHATSRFILLIDDNQAQWAKSITSLDARLERVRAIRLKSDKKETREFLANVPHRFQHRGAIGNNSTIIVPSVSSENREWFPAGLLQGGAIVSNLAFLMPDAPLWSLALLVSKLHLIWIATVCGKLKTDYRYSNTLGWNTFPVPTLTEQNKTDLTRCVQDILLAREAHFPATIADLYDPESMPDDLRAAHDRNDETLERIYIGRRFKNDTERLETLFAMYAKMTEGAGAATKSAGSKPRGRKKKEVPA